MKVQQILASKPSAAVETISASALVSEAACVLSAKRIGALVVSEDGETVAGIVSERDIVRRLGESGAGCLDQTVGSIMTTDVVTVAPAETAVSVLQRMTEGRFRHIPVMEDGKLAGLISIGDVVKARIAEVEFENTAMASMLGG